jgi:threonyl-tRNA synthetase
VRQISLDDTHVFCRPDQAGAEISRALRSALEAQRVLGLPVDHVRLSRGGSGDGYLGSADQWRDAEESLRSAAADVLRDLPLPLVEAAGEAAFYGPKLDLQVRGRRGHEETIATVQLDFNQPERFDLGYDAADGTRHRVVMIHRGTVGAMERVVAALLEHYSGRLPLWLAPIQVCVLPVAPAQDDYARALVHDLRAAGLRARLETDGSLGARVRASRHRRDALICVTGAAEANSDSVHVTDPAAAFAGPVARDRFIAAVDDARGNRSPRIAWPAEPMG